jgi:8-oxo-dGTP pyrophosphatase MutT (NUDIX family)
VRSEKACASLIEGLVRALHAAREFRPQDYLSLRSSVSAIGWIRRDLAVLLRSWPKIFEISEENIRLRPVTEAELSAALAEVAQALARDGAIRGWRGETYAVRDEAGGEALFHIERAAMRFFGLTSSAAHLNGCVFRNENPIIWIARRAATKSIDPGMLDNLVAGGVASGQDAWQALLRECGEEAGIPVALAEKARPAGVLRVCRAVPEGLHSEILHIHDLALPADFAPRNTDGEVSEFLSLDAQALCERIARGEMTIEAGLVAADFAIRHGLVNDGDGNIGAAIEACRGPTLP